MELIIIRHGTTQGNLERRFVGMLDVPLAPEGEALAREVSRTLPLAEGYGRPPVPFRQWSTFTAARFGAVPRRRLCSGPARRRPL